MKKIVEIKNVSKTFIVGKNKYEALKNINLEINEGEFVSIIGSSGAGKTTLQRVINKLIDVTEGEVIINSQNLTNAKGKELRLIRAKIGMIFQQFNLVKNAKVISNVLIGRIPFNSTFRNIFKLFSDEDKNIAFESLDSVGLLDHSFKRCDKLSGGQQQRVAIAKVLAQKPILILADEPVSALDPVTVKKVLDDIKRINIEKKITTIVNFHHVELAKEYSTRIIGVKDGEIIFDDKPSKLTKTVLDKIYSKHEEE